MKNRKYAKNKGEPLEGACEGSFSIERKRSKLEIVVGHVKMSVKLISVYLIPLLVSIYCLYTFYAEVPNQRVFNIAYGAYLIILANAAVGFPFFNDESFTDVKVLLDYAQEILPLPFVCSELWIKSGGLNDYAAYAHAILGAATFFFLVVYEFKRMDLTDLTVLVNTTSLVTYSFMYENWAALASALVFPLYYAIQKRNEHCCLRNKFVFDYVMMVFNLLTLVAFQPNLYVPKYIDGVTNGFWGLLPRLRGWFSSTPAPQQSTPAQSTPSKQAVSEP